MKIAFVPCATLLGLLPSPASGSKATQKSKPVVSEMVAFDISHPVRDMEPSAIKAGGGNDAVGTEGAEDDNVVLGYRPLDPLAGTDSHKKFKKDGALDHGGKEQMLDDPEFVFEGLSSDDNADLLGFRVVPPDPVGDVGKHHYVQMTNVAFAVYHKEDGSLANGPFALGSLWEGFAIEDCAKSNGDPIVVYDQLEERWILTQFTRGPRTTSTFFNCLAVSETDDPTGSYYRYAFPAQQAPKLPVGVTVFPDYPKWGVWGDSYILTTRDFYYDNLGSFDKFGASVYAIEKAAVVSGQKNARWMRFTATQCGDDPCPSGTIDTPAYLVNNGLLPPDIDGQHHPPPGAPAPIIGTVDDGVQFDNEWVSVDGMNIFELSVDWAYGTGSLDFVSLSAVAPFTSTNTRKAVPQPGVSESNYLHALGVFVMYRLAYRNEGDYESMVFTQSVVVDKGPPFKFGVRWYEVRRIDGAYKIYQQGTYSPKDPTSRWLGSIAKDGNGNIALGFSVSDQFSVYPGIRLTARMKDDPLGKMTLGEATVVNGGGSQLGSGNRWGDYASMNIDPEDDCTFWFTSEYIPFTGDFNWRTKITSFKLPGCESNKSNKKKKKKEKNGVRHT